MGYKKKGWFGRGDRRREGSEVPSTTHCVGFSRDPAYLLMNWSSKPRDATVRIFSIASAAVCPASSNSFVMVFIVPASCNICTPPGRAEHDKGEGDGGKEEWRRTGTGQMQHLYSSWERGERVEEEGRGERVEEHGREMEKNGGAGERGG